MYLIAHMCRKAYMYLDDYFFMYNYKLDIQWLIPAKRGKEINKFFRNIPFSYHIVDHMYDHMVYLWKTITSTIHDYYRGDRHGL